MNWGVRSMVWYVIVIIIAIVVSLFFYNQLMSDPTIKSIYL